jgi:hypothetical protein
VSWGPEHWSAVANGFVALAAVGGAIAAFVGLGTWKNQLNWQSNNDLAKRVLLALYRYRDAIFALRNPTILGVEMVADNGTAVSSKYPWDGTAVALARRLTLLRSMRSELDGVLQEAEAHWGVLLKLQFDTIFKEEKRLIRAVQLFLRSLDQSSSKEDRERAMQRGKEGGSIHFRSTVVDPDAFTLSFEELVSTVAESLRAKFGRTP